MTEKAEPIEVTIMFQNGTKETWRATPEVAREIATDVAIGKDGKVYDVWDQKGHKRVLTLRWRDILYVG